jgi:cell division protein FtsZ
VIDPNLGDEIRVTVIATGFERAGMPRRTIERPAAQGTRGVQRSAAAGGTNPVPAEQPVASTRQSELSEFQPRSYNTDDLDIPAFLRRR